MTPEFKLSSEENSNREFESDSNYNRGSFNIVGFTENKTPKLRQSTSTLEHEE
jgi:hypothetical protein